MSPSRLISLAVCPMLAMLVGCAEGTESPSRGGGAADTGVGTGDAGTRDGDAGDADGDGGGPGDGDGTGEGGLRKPLTIQGTQVAGGLTVVTGNTAVEEEQVTVACPPGSVIESYTSLYGVSAGGTCPTACGSCTPGDSSCTVNFGHSNGECAGDCDQGTLKLSTLELTCVGAAAATDFPVLVNLTDADLLAKADSSGLDIRFTDDAGDPLPFEREDYDSATGTIRAWVKMDLTGADQVFYVNYGGGDLSDTSTPTSVWDGYYRGVWHLDDVASVTDSSAGGHTGTNNGTTSVPGAIGGAANTTGGYVAIPVAAASGITTQLTASMWLHGDPALQPAAQMAFMIGTDATDRVTAHPGYSDGNVYWDSGGCCADGQRISRAITAGGCADDNSCSFIEGQWNHWVFVKNTTSGTAASDGAKIYVNGALWHSGDGSTAMAGSWSSFNLGANSDGASFYAGYIDEFRVSDVERDAGWILTEYNNQLPGSTFLTVGVEQSL